MRRRSSRASRGQVRGQGGFTLIDTLLGVIILAVGVAAILAASSSQVLLNEHVRYMALASTDAHRVLERIREGSEMCTTAVPNPRSVPPGGNTSWHQWLIGNGGLSLPEPERIVVTCRSAEAASPGFCDAAQIGAGEWHAGMGPAAVRDPMQITVAVCWRHRTRTVGECSWGGGVLTPNDALPTANDTAGVIDSAVMVTTLVTCQTRRF